MLVKVLVEVAEVRARKASCHFSPSAFRILPGGGAAGGGGGGPYMQGFVSYIPPPPFVEFCKEKLTVMQVQGLKGLRM